MENSETQDTTPTPEELETEQEALTEVGDDDLRSNVIESLDLEENDDNKELIDKFVAIEKENRTKLSKAIGQKIDWREKAKSNTQPKKQEENDSKTAEGLDAESIRKQTEETVKSQFDEEYLEDSDYSDDLKAEMRKIAKVNGTSVRSASKDSYIQHLINEEKSENQSAEAANNGTGERKSGKDGSQGMPDKFTEPTFMMTEEGQKEYEEWEKSK